MKYIDINPSNFNTQIAIFNAELQKRSSIYAMIHATWCGACKRVGPHWKQLETKSDLNAVVAYIDSDVIGQMGHILSEGDIQHYPTFMRIQGTRKFVLENPPNATVDTFVKWIKKKSKSKSKSKTKTRSTKKRRKLVTPSDN